MRNPICIIPARGISSGLPKKNFKRIDGKPLVAHTIESASESEKIDSVIISTESERLAKISKEYGAEVPFIRPAELSDPDVLLNEVIQHSVSELRDRGYGIGDKTPLVILQPDVPFTRAEYIDTAIEQYKQDHDHAVLSVIEKRDFFWQSSNNHLEPLRNQRTLRSELEPFYQETGSIYVTNNSILAGGSRVGQEPSYVVTDKLSGFKIDSLTDLWLAKKIKQGPEIMFRVDGGDEIGMGHVHRCITLARNLDEFLSSSITFITDRRFAGGINKLQSTKFDIVTKRRSDTFKYIKSANPDIVFTDILDTSGKHIRQLHETSAAIINLEDLGDGAEHADYVINALYQEDSGKQNKLSGARYLIIDNDFHKYRSEIHPQVENILLTFGGSDPSNMSTQALDQLGSVRLPYQYRLVLGSDFSHNMKLEQLPDTITSQVTIIRNSANMPKMMQWADIAICSGGRTAYELAATGTPTIVVAHNNREAKRMQNLDLYGAVSFLGRADEIENDSIATELVALDKDFDRRATMSDRAIEFVDDGGLQRILDLVHDIIIG